MRRISLLSVLFFLQILAAISFYTACSEKQPQSEHIALDGLDILYNYTPVYEEEQVLRIPEEDVVIIDDRQAGLPPGEFIANAADVAAGSHGEIILLDSNSCRIFIFSEEGKYLTSFGRSGSGPGEFSSPYRLTRLNNDRIIVTESMDSKAQIFTMKGMFIQQLTFPMTMIRCIASDGGEGFFLSDRALQRKPGETGNVNGTILYRLNRDGEVTPFNLTTGEQDTLEIARDVVTGEVKYYNSISNSKNLYSTPDGSALVAGLNYTLYRVSKEGRVAGFRRVGERFSYPRWYTEAVRERWVQRGARGNPPSEQGFYIEPNAMAVDERGHLWVMPSDGYVWMQMSSIEDFGKVGTFVLDEFSSEGIWLRHIQVQLPEPCFGFHLSDAANGCLYGTTYIGDPEDEIRMPMKFKRP